MKTNGAFGDKAFYKRVFSVMVPIMVQGAFTNFVNMLDNLMVGRLGTAEMTGVSIANQERGSSLRSFTEAAITKVSGILSASRSSSRFSLQPYSLLCCISTRML